ncbi:NTF2 fold immunity protein [Methylobacterium oryzihabitans]|uniref:NTF2 fold immunity protein n=1 Tax=Methylobacterium oryzihabitans TaxID=2499852 RepID=UPI00165298AB|nr:NTF2 fold immunity protein [Methylobacterium oryzihabitans]
MIWPVLVEASDRRCASPVDLAALDRGIVPDAATAEAVAFVYLASIYGEAHIRGELPLRARLSDGIWTVEGTLPPGFVGGTAQILLCQRNGTVLSVIHFK